jgi:acyl dehydratase
MEVTEKTAGESQEASSGRITEADIERARRQIGVPKFSFNQPYNALASPDVMRHFAWACGDDNPLWHDLGYAAKTRWRDQIAFPLFLHSTGTNLTPKPDAEQKALFKGLFRGVGKYYTGVEWTWWRPIYPDEQLYVERVTSAIKVNEKSSFSGGISVTEVYRDLWVDRAGIPVGQREESYLSAEREGSKKAGRYANIQRQSYTPDDISRVDEIYAAERRRGREKRLWEDVEIGNALTPIAKGPLTMVDVIAMHMGLGLSSSGIGPLRFNWRQRSRMPAFYVADRYGVPDVVQRVHWDHDRATELGLPTSYDYGQMRTSWLIHLVTNWMGDDAWLWKLDCQSRAFNFMGDTTICTGEVTDKRIEGAHRVVELKLAGTNQRGEVTAPGTAIVILPSRASGPVMLPTPPSDIGQRGADMLQGSADRTLEPNSDAFKLTT